MLKGAEWTNSNHYFEAVLDVFSSIIETLVLKICMLQVIYPKQKKAQKPQRVPYTVFKAEPIVSDCLHTNVVYWLIEICII